MTPQEAKELLGVSDNCIAQVKGVGNDCYRVNILTKATEKGSIISKNTIVKSAYVRFKDGKYQDITITPNNRIS
jgi:hypothetical protein